MIEKMLEIANIEGKRKKATFKVTIPLKLSFFNNISFIALKHLL